MSTDPAAAPVDQANTVLTPETLAIADTILAYCAQVDIGSASAYQSAITIFTQGHLDTEAANLRATPEYAKAQGLFTNNLAGYPLASGAAACRAFSTVSHKMGVTSPIRTPVMGSH